MFSSHDIRFAGLVVLLLSALSTAAAQNEIDNPAQIDTPEELQQAEENPGGISSDDLARDLNNPNAPLAKLTIEYSRTTFDGDLSGADDESADLILFKPVFPFPLTEDGTRNLFIRPVFAYAANQPVYDPDDDEFDSESGFGDLGFDVALGQSYDNGVILVGGLQGSIPVGSDSLTSDQYRLGPEFIVAHIDENRVLAAFPAHQWDISGDGPDYSTTTLELFALKFLAGGWTVGTQPAISYDWENSQATVPVNLTIRKVVKLGGMPMQVAAGLDYFVEGDDDFAPEYALTLNVTPIVPNFIYNMLN